MLDLIPDKPFLVAIMAGACAQLIKVLSFLALERRVNYRRFVQTDGAPNMHSTAFTALTYAVGFQDGTGSLTFAFAVCLTAIILVDTMNVKTAASRQAEAIDLLLNRMRHRQASAQGTKKALSYRPIDVFSGVLLGILVAAVLV
jgi:acid phosphatase family membrane protein YuiD